MIHPIIHLHNTFIATECAVGSTPQIGFGVWHLLLYGLSVHRFPIKTDNAWLSICALVYTESHYGNIPHLNYIISPSSSFIILLCLAFLAFTVPSDYIDHTAVVLHGSQSFYCQSIFGLIWWHFDCPPHFVMICRKSQRDRYTLPAVNLAPSELLYSISRMLNKTGTDKYWQTVYFLKIDSWG
jgi:hypothetical protein